MATLTYDGVNFATTLGGLPRISREITKRIDEQTGVLIDERHVVSLEWHGVPAAGTLAQQQAAITTIEAAIEALSEDGALIFSDNAGNVCWAYNSSASANNHATPLGVQITKISFPWGSAKHITNDPIRLTFEMVVQPCSNDPITGIGSLVYQTTEEWDTSGLVSISYVGTLCACDGSSAKDLLITLRETLFIPDARDRFTAAGAILTDVFGPTSLSKSELDQEDHCIAFRWMFGGGAPPAGISARTLDVEANVQIIQNLVTLDMAATYGYRGRYRGTGSGTPQIFGTPTPSGSIFSGGWPGGSAFGLPGGGASDFSTVWNEAFNFAGIDVRQFLPPGAGSIFLLTEPQLGINTAARTITSRKRFYAPWIWDMSILLYDMDVNIEIPRPGFGSRRLMHIAPSTPAPRPYCNTSGYDAMRVTFTATIVAKQEYKELPLQLTEDPMNVWFVGHTLGGLSKLPNQIRQSLIVLPQNFQEGYVTSRVTQVWAVRDPSIDTTLKSIEVGSIRKVQTVVNIKPITMGSASEGGLKS